MTISLSSFCRFTQEPANRWLQTLGLKFQNTGFPLLSQSFFVFLPDLVDIGKHFFQFGKVMPLGKMIRIGVQITNKPTVIAFPIVMCNTVLSFFELCKAASPLVDERENTNKVKFRRFYNVIKIQ